MRVRIESDGTARNTRIYDAETGDDLTAKLAVMGITWFISGPDNVAKATLQIEMIGLNVEGFAQPLTKHPRTGHMEPVRAIEFEDGERIEFKAS